MKDMLSLDDIQIVLKQSFGLPYSYTGTIRMSDGSPLNEPVIIGDGYLKGLVVSPDGLIGKIYDGNPLTIAAISSKGMIFIHGNEHIGLAHIVSRHSHFSTRSDWYIDQENKPEIDNPSKFNKHSNHLADFCAIVDNIYKPENLAISKKPDIFEKYTGFSNRIQNKDLKFHLIVYTGTKIVHSLFPQEKVFNKRKKIINFKRGDLEVIERVVSKTIVAKYPYTNYKGIERYVITIVLNKQTFILTTYVQLNDLKGEPLVSIPVSQGKWESTKTDGETYFYGIESVDLSKVERWIKSFEKTYVLK